MKIKSIFLISLLLIVITLSAVSASPADSVSDVQNDIEKTDILMTDDLDEDDDDDEDINDSYSEVSIDIPDVVEIGGGDDIEIELPEDRPVTLGRDQRADIILNSKDNKLSGAHCRVLLKNGHLLVWDADSTNGTTVDGVPLRDGASAALESGRTLGVGSYEYRVEIS